MKPVAMRKKHRLPPRSLSAIIFRLMPLSSRRYDYGDIVEQYRAVYSTARADEQNAREANTWLAGVIAKEVWRFLPDAVRQFLIALTIAAIMSA